MAATRGADGGREAIVDAAMAAVASEGLRGLRVRAVARDCGITHATLHYYFASKAELLRAVVDRVIHGGIAAPLVEDVAPLPPLEQLRRLLLGLLDRSRDDAHAAVMLEMMRHGHSEDLAVPFTEYIETWHHYLLGLIADGMATGQMRADLDPVGTSGMLMEFSLGLQTRTPLPPGVAERAIDQVIALLAAGT